MKYALSTLAVAALTAGAANAGGYTPVVVDTAPVVTPVTVAPVGNWAGGYVGGTLGYAFGGDDVVGLRDTTTDALADDLGKLEIGGANASLRAGYRWQRGNLVFGPELSVEGGSIDDEIDLTDAAGADLGLSASNEVNHVIALKMKTGYEVAPNTLVFGTAGIARGDFTYTLAADGGASASEDYTANGYVFGVGVERKVSDRMSITGEIERNHFKRETVDFGPVTTEASPSYNNIKLGVNFSF